MVGSVELMGFGYVVCWMDGVRGIRRRRRTRRKREGRGMAGIELGWNRKSDMYIYIYIYTCTI